MKRANSQIPFNDPTAYGIDYFEQADVNADASNLPFLADIANLVLLTEVLEHLPDPARALQEINRVMHRKGYLVLTVPLIFGVHDHVDYQRWTERGLTKLLNDSGFEVLRLKKRGGIFSTIGSLMTQIPMQIIGEMEQLKRQRQWWRVGIHLAIWAALVPIPWLLSPLDRFDYNKNFTFGYSVLCRKK